MRSAFIALWLAVQFGVPLHYYLGSQPFEERFAWRMFSPVRMVACQTKFIDASDGASQPVRVGTDLHETWAHLMSRARSSVVEAYGRRWCDTERAAGRHPVLHVDVTCTNPDTIEKTICRRGAADDDGDGVPDGYRMAASCRGQAPSACFRAECGALDAKACQAELCQVRPLPLDQDLCQ